MLIMIIVFVTFLNFASADTNNPGVRGSVVTITHTDKKTGGTAVIILSQWLLTSRTCINDRPKQEFTITARLTGGATTTYTIDKIICDKRPSAPILCLIKTNVAFPVSTRQFAIATRTDMLWRVPCKIYSTDRNFKLIRYHAMPTRHHCAPQMYLRNYTVCAKTAKNVTLSAHGSVLVCLRRVLGVCYDGKEDPHDMHYFASLWLLDEFVLNTLAAQDAGNFKPRYRSSISKGVEVKDRSSFWSLCVLLTSYAIRSMR